MINRRKFIQGTVAAIGTTYLSSMIPTLSKEKFSIPRKDGFFFPAEWLPHEMTLMQFPPAQNWARYNLQEVQKNWAKVANIIQEYEKVKMVVAPNDLPRVKKIISKSIEIIELPLNDGWARDSIPIFLLNKKGNLRAVNFIFNGWGKKFDSYEKDAALKERLCKRLSIDFYNMPLVGEGGAVSSNGKGTLITTEECLLNTNRNPHQDKEEVGNVLKKYLSVEKIIWLPKGLTPDPITDGHVDGICVFVSENRVLLHTTDDRSDPNYKITQEAKRILLSSTTAEAKKIEIIEMPLADDVAHINFYIANGLVLVPTAGEKKQDDRPMGILKEVFPERDVIGVDGKILAKGGGGIHCITQQVPQV